MTIQCIACRHSFNLKDESEFTGEWRGQKMCQVCEILCKRHEKNYQNTKSIPKQPKIKDVNG